MLAPAPLGQLAPGQELGSPQAPTWHPAHLQPQQLHAPTDARALPYPGHTR